MQGKNGKWPDNDLMVTFEVLNKTLFARNVEC